MNKTRSKNSKKYYLNYLNQFSSGTTTKFLWLRTRKATYRRVKRQNNKVKQTNNTNLIKRTHTLNITKEFNITAHYCSKNMSTNPSNTVKQWFFCQIGMYYTSASSWDKLYTVNLWYNFLCSSVSPTNLWNIFNTFHTHVPNRTPNLEAAMKYTFYQAAI